MSGPTTVMSSTGDVVPVRGKSTGEMLVADNSGGSGGTVSVGTVQAVGPFRAIQVFEDCVFSEFTEVGFTGAMTGLIVPAGMTIFGSITSYTLSSGKVRAYKV